MNITEKEILELTRIMNLKYASSLFGKKFSISTKEENLTLTVKMTLSDESSGFHYPCHAQASLKNLEHDKKDAYLIMIDFLDCYFEEYLQSEGEVLLTIHPKVYEYEGLEFKVHGQIFDRLKEQMADKILNEANQDKNQSL